ncbi:DUF721 domain-containing protein [Blastopirellula sp. JC732]|uniref:DUF721 domain-containing protein n=1 Tax=Blastopirellula sediminis TaxID=2894196 RepID=A0A9X1MQ32_9BACT|nr:DUF721 domain-containing protein [Blastopirellula sediminis]MCC9606756.1 DUF721 domain-containing protein [Blastopirellula sediminis]MCC9629947.1 DUF721 domain-containing protein [Blastopirellula sediminis]
MKPPRRDERSAPRGPQAMGDLVAGLMARSGYAQVQSADALQEAWAKAAGEEVAAHSRAGNVNRGKLEVWVENSAISQAISFQKREILKQLQNILPDRRIEEIRIKVGRIN